MLPIFPELGAVSCVGVSRGTSPQLEGLSQAIAGLVFDRTLPRDFGKRARAMRFNQINSKTGSRIKYKKVDADTGDEVVHLTS